MERSGFGLNALSGLPCMSRRRMQLDTRRANQLQYGVVPRLCARSQSLVQALTPKPSALGQRVHTPSLCDVSDCLKKHVGVLIFQCGIQLLGNDNVVVEIVGGIKSGDILHGQFSRLLRRVLAFKMSFGWDDLSPAQ